MFAKRVSYLALGLSACLVPSSAFANGFQVFKRDYNAAPVLIKNLPTLMSDSMNNWLNRNRTAIEAAVVAEVSKPNLIGRGIQLKNVVFHLGKPAFRFTSTGSFEVTISGNHFYSMLAVDGPLRDELKAVYEGVLYPRFELNFDLRLVGNMALPTATDPRFRVTHAVLNVPTASAQGRNISGKLVTVFYTAKNYFEKLTTGRDTLQRAASRYLQVDLTNSLAAWIGAVNVPMLDLHRQGFTNPILVLDGARNVVSVTMAKPNVLPRRPVGKKASLETKKLPSNIIAK